MSPRHRLPRRSSPGALTLAALAAASASAVPARAAEIDLATRIERVTVHPDAALVTRIGALDLPAGASTLTLRGLPAGLDPASVRVEGRGSEGLAIGAVDVRTVPGDAAAPVRDPALEARLTRLRDEGDGLAARLSALEVKRGAIERYAQAGPERLGDDGHPLAVADWSAAWEALGAGLAAVAEDLRQGAARKRAVEAEIAEITRVEQMRAPGGPRPVGPRREVTVSVEAGAALTGELGVTYRVAGASWTPLYDARLDTGGDRGAGKDAKDPKDAKPRLELVRRAQVVQRTGEAWDGVALAVSTTRVERGAAAPEVAPLQVSFYEPPPYVLPAPRTRALNAAPVAPAAPSPAPPDEERARAARDAAAAVAEARVVPAVQQGASLEAGGYDATFRVPGRVGVAPDGSPKTFVLGSQRLEPELAVAASPELDPTAYLRAAFVHAEEAPLLPGEVALNRDGAFVGRTRVGLVPPGDRVELGFGADERVKVARVPVRRRENEPTWIGQTKTELREFKTSVRNLHATPVRVTITDRLPYSENTAITVETLRDSTPATEKAPGDRRGVVAWSYDLAPGESRDIRLAYRLRWPADRDVVFEAKPVAPGPRS